MNFAKDDAVAINSKNRTSTTDPLRIATVAAGKGQIGVTLCLLQSGAPFNVIALWLGHESTNTTHRYVEADLAMKENALAQLEVPATKLRQFRAPDPFMPFLQTS